MPPEFNLFKVVLGFALIPLYIVYTIYTLKTGEASCGEGEQLKNLYVDGFIRKCTGKSGEPVECPVASDGNGNVMSVRRNEPGTALIILQVLASLGLIILGANMFVQQIEGIAHALSINPLILALIIAPIATELPEKFNSLLWIRARKDTFAIGNITGAMVFQSCIPVTIGIVLTGWHLDVIHQHRVPAGCGDLHSVAVGNHPVQGVQPQGDQDVRADDRRSALRPVHNPGIAQHLIGKTVKKIQNFKGRRCIW